MVFERAVPVQYKETVTVNTTPTRIWIDLNKDGLFAMSRAQALDLIKALQEAVGYLPGVKK